MSIHSGGGQSSHCADSQASIVVGESKAQPRDIYDKATVKEWGMVTQIRLDDWWGNQSLIPDGHGHVYALITLSFNTCGFCLFPLSQLHILPTSLSFHETHNNGRYQNEKLFWSRRPRETTYEVENQIKHRSTESRDIRLRRIEFRVQHNQRNIFAQSAEKDLVLQRVKLSKRCVAQIKLKVLWQTKGMGVIIESCYLLRVKSLLFTCHPPHVAY